MIEEILTEVVRLAQAGGLPILAVLGLVLFGAVVLVLVRRAEGFTWPKPTPEEPTPDAVWNTDPTQGAVVVPGPPGGSDDPIQGG